MPCKYICYRLAEEGSIRNADLHEFTQ